MQHIMSKMTSLTGSVGTLIEKKSEDFTKLIGQVEKSNITNNNQPRVSKEVEKTSVIQNDINNEHVVEETASLSGTSDAVTTDNPNDTDDAAKNILV